MSPLYRGRFKLKHTKSVSGHPDLEGELTALLGHRARLSKGSPRHMLGAWKGKVKQHGELRERDLLPERKWKVGAVEMPQAPFTGVYLS